MAEIASAFVSIAPSARGFGSKLSSQVGGETRTAGASLGRTFGKLFVLGAGVIAAAGIGNFLKGSVDEAREAQKVGAQTNAVLKSTGGIANVSAGQIGRLSTALSNKIGVDDEAIQSGANLLLTFTNVRNEAGKGNDIFNQATKTVQDMAAAFGGDAVSNSKILGKALNDPVKGVSALTRVGVTFTEGQKDQIASLVKTGNTLGAQKIILGELSKESAGSAVAQVTNAEKASVAYGNLKETVGGLLLPVIDKLAAVFTNSVAPAISTFVAQLKSGEGAGGRVAAVFVAVTAAVATFVAQLQNGTGVGGQVAAVITQIASALSTVFSFIQNNQAVVATFVAVIGTAVAVARAFAAAQLLVNVALTANPIGLVIVAIAALAAGLVYAYKKSDTFRAIVDGAFKGIKKVVSSVINFIVPFVKSHWGLLVSIIGGPVGIVVVQIIKHFGTIKQVVGSVATFVVNSAKKYGEFVSAVISKVGQVVKFFKDLPGKIKGFLTKLPGEMKTLGGNIVEGLVKGIGAAAGKVASAVQSIIDKIPKFIRKRMGIASPSKVTTKLGSAMGEGLAVGIGSQAAAVVTATGDVVNAAAKKAADTAKEAHKKLVKKTMGLYDSLKDKLSGLRDDFAGLVDPIASNFTQGLFDFDNASGFVANLTSTSGTLGKLLNAFTTLKGFGLSPGFLYQLFQNGGAGLILDLAGNKDLAVQAGTTFGQITDLSNQLGNRVALATDKGADIQHQTDVLGAKLDKVIDKLGNLGVDVGDAVNKPAKNARKRGKKKG